MAIIDGVTQFPFFTVGKLFALIPQGKAQTFPVAQCFQKAFRFPGIGRFPVLRRGIGAVPVKIKRVVGRGIPVDFHHAVVNGGQVVIVALFRVHLPPLAVQVRRRRRNRRTPVVSPASADHRRKQQHTEHKGQHHRDHQDCRIDKPAFFHFFSPPCFLRIAAFHSGGMYFPARRTGSGGSSRNFRRTCANGSSA